MSCMVVLEGELRSWGSLKIFRGHEHTPNFSVTSSNQDKLKSHIYSLSISFSNFYLFFTSVAVSSLLISLLLIL